MKVCSACGIEKELTEFYTAKSNRDGLTNTCRECVKARNAAYSRANPEKRKIYSAKYRTTNAEKVKAYNAAYRDANRENLRAAGDAYRAANPDKIKAASATYRATYPEKCKARVAACTRANPERVSANRQRRRARLACATGEHTPAELIAQRAHQHDKCWYCDTPLGGKGHVEHMTPISRGGSNDISNIVYACASCNLRKHSMTADEFLTALYGAPLGEMTVAVHA